MLLTLFFVFFESCKNCCSIFWRIAKTPLAPLFIVVLNLAGCSGFSTSSMPSFGFGGTTASTSPDCSKIDKRMTIAHKRYAKALVSEQPAIYLNFTGHLSRSLKANRLKGIYQMTDVHLNEVVDHTRNTCLRDRLGQAQCNGANRLGQAYKPLVLAARQSHENYCGNRPIR